MVDRSASEKPSILIVSLAGIRFATRPRKAARELARTHDVRYLALQSSGRGARVDEAGVFTSAGIPVHQVRVRPRRQGGSRFDKAWNLVVSYLPAFARLFWVAWRTRASSILIANPVLAPIALAHRARYGSRIVLDVAERPGAIAAKDSLASLFSKLEAVTLRMLARPADAIATVAVPSDAATIRAFGFSRVLPLRNAPLESWRADYCDPEQSATLKCVVVGSVFEGRAYEILIRAMALLAARGEDVQLRIVGPGSAEYLDRLRMMSAQLGADEAIVWGEAVDSEHVSQQYLDAHVGLVLYEPGDPGNDGLSNKILECVSSGRPVLAGNLSENQSFVTRNQVGWLTEVSPEHIAQSLTKIRRTANLIEISRHCRDLGDDSLTWETDFRPVTEALLSR